jgi:tetratricopeptide (TPR) repeat protein
MSSTVLKTNDWHIAPWWQSTRAGVHIGATNSWGTFLSNAKIGVVRRLTSRWPSLRPDVGMFWRFLADALAMLGERDEAERNYRRALSLGVNDVIANAKYGLLLKQAGRFRKAQAYLQRALDFRPHLAKSSRRS